MEMKVMRVYISDLEFHTGKNIQHENVGNLEAAILDVKRAKGKRAIKAKMKIAFEQASYSINGNVVSFVEVPESFIDSDNNFTTESFEHMTKFIIPILTDKIKVISGLLSTEVNNHALIPNIGLENFVEIEEENINEC